MVLWVTLLWGAFLWITPAAARRRTAQRRAPARPGDPPEEGGVFGKGMESAWSMLNHRRWGTRSDRYGVPTGPLGRGVDVLTIAAPASPTPAPPSNLWKTEMRLC